MVFILLVPTQIFPIEGFPLFQRKFLIIKDAYDLYLQKARLQTYFSQVILNFIIRHKLQMLYSIQRVSGNTKIPLPVDRLNRVHL